MCRQGDGRARELSRLWRYFPELLFGAAWDAGELGEFAVDAGDAFDLALGGEAFVKALVAKGAGLLGPGFEALAPASDAVFLGLGVVRGEVGADAHHGLEGDGFGDHEIGVAPGLSPGLRGGLEEIAGHGVVTGGEAFVGAFAFDAFPGLFDPAMDFVEELGLEDPFFLLAAAAEAVDAVAEGAVAFAVEHFRNVS